MKTTIVSSPPGISKPLTYPALFRFDGDGCHRGTVLLVKENRGYGTVLVAANADYPVGTRWDTRDWDTASMTVRLTDPITITFEP